MTDLTCPKCGAHVVGNGPWRIDVVEAGKCLDLRGTEHWGDITWCPTLAAEAFKRDWIWNGHTYRARVIAEIEAVQAAKVEKDKPPA